jgi:hypothetical protein
VDGSHKEANWVILDWEGRGAQKRPKALRTTTDRSSVAAARRCGSRGVAPLAHGRAPSRSK